MKKFRRILAKALIKLDRIPAYRRMYSWNAETKSFSNMHWRYLRNGYWGITLFPWILDELDPQPLGSEWKDVGWTTDD